MLGQGGFFGLNDNMLYFPPSTYLDWNGVAFTVGPDAYNVYASNLGLYSEDSSNQTTSSLDTFAASDVPEPALWPLTAMGLAGFLIRRRRCRA